MNDVNLLVVTSVHGLFVENFPVMESELSVMQLDSM